MLIINKNVANSEKITVLKFSRKETYICIYTFMAGESDRDRDRERNHFTQSTNLNVNLIQNTLSQENLQ